MLDMIRLTRASSAAMDDENAVARVQEQSKRGTQVAAVAGVRGVPAAAGVLGG